MFPLRLIHFWRVKAELFIRKKIFVRFFLLLKLHNTNTQNNISLVFFFNIQDKKRNKTNPVTQTVLDKTNTDSWTRPRPRGRTFTSDCVEVIVIFWFLKAALTHLHLLFNTLLSSSVSFKLFGSCFCIKWASVQRLKIINLQHVNVREETFLHLEGRKSREQSVDF